MECLTGVRQFGGLGFHSMGRVDMEKRNYDKKVLRKGYTTGTCAAAVSKAAVLMLLSQSVKQEIKVLLPGGSDVELGLVDCEFSEEFARCAVVKDGGDDPDATNGIKICARAWFDNGIFDDKDCSLDMRDVASKHCESGRCEMTGRCEITGISEMSGIFEIKVSFDDAEVGIRAGEGIGRVTLPGLKVEVGEPAINPVPRKMIADAVAEVLKGWVDKGAGFLTHCPTCPLRISVEITVPEGGEIAKKTYNPRLGIVGGISILGTTGIVEPVSEEAWMEALEAELSVMTACGYKNIVFTFGSIGEDYAVKNMGIDRSRIIKTSNFYGFCLESAARFGVEKILVVGHIGKLVKVAAGIFNTHSRVADARMETLAAYCALEGAETKVVEKVYGASTTQMALGIIEEHGLVGVYDRVVRNAVKKSVEYVYGEIDIEILMIDHRDECIGESSNVAEFIKELIIYYEEWDGKSNGC